MEVVVSQYNTKRITIKMSPNEARQEGNKLTASFKIWAQSKKDRVYPELKDGDAVRVMLTNDCKTKRYMPKWSTDTVKVLHIKDHDYLIINNKRKVYLRHELLMVV